MRKRTPEDYKKLVTDLGKGITVIGRYVNTDTPIRHKHSCGHIWWVKPDHILNSGSGCPRCSYRARAEHLSAIQTGRPSRRRKTHDVYEAQVLAIHRGRIRVIGIYTTSFEKIKHQCVECNFRWLATPDNITNSSKTGCPKCAKGKRHSGKAIRWLQEEAKRRGIRIRHAGNWGEYAIPGTRLRVDGFHKPTNTIFDFYGDCFHGNPDLFGPRYRCHPFSTKTAARLYAETLARENYLRSLGYNLVIMWESDYDG